MTQQLARGARQALNRVEDECEDIREAVRLLDGHRYDPLYVHDRVVEIEDALARLARRLREDVEPLLIRQDIRRNLDGRFAEIEDRLASLEAERRLRT